MIYSLPKYFQPLIYKVIKWHYRKPRKIMKRGIEMTLLPTVFHPNFYLSTDIFLDYILSLNLEKGNALELGCGNGFISLYLAKNAGLKIFASDINPAAIDGINKNALKNNVEIRSFHSNLFDDIPNDPLDYIFINPPYYKAAPKEINEHAFFAGQELEYFENLFSQMKARENLIGKTYFILSENAPITKIQSIAEKHKLKLKEVFTKKKNNELFLIYLSY